MKTQLEIRDDLMQEALRLSELPTHQAVVEKALENFVYDLLLKKINALRGPGVWEGNLEEMRTA
jgi:Arc/MetJ family transcription regulator